MVKSLFFLISVLFLSKSVAESPNLSSVYDELKDNGFPIGLLPTNVRSYYLNRTSGDFSVDLDGHCRIKLPPDNYLASYSERITGNLREGRIAELDGICVRAFFRWWSITAIRSTGDDLVFEVGVASAKYPSRNFDEILECEGSPKKADS